MRAVVTGAAGFIGSALASCLASEGHDVVAVDSLVTGSKEAIPDDVEFVEVDVRDLAAVAGSFSGAEVVFHQAAVGSVVRSLEDPLLTHECNVTGTLNVLLAAERAGCRRVVYASSSSVYGDTGGALNKEDMAPQPRTPYAVSKLAGEHYCRAWALLERLSTVSLRYFNVFGPGQPERSRYSAVFPAFIAALRAAQPPELHGDGEQSREFTYIDDVVAANLLAADAGDEANAGVFNIASGDPKSVNDVLKAVSQALDVWIEPTRTPPREGDIRHSRADTSRAVEVLGWKPQAQWQEAAAATVASFVDG